MDDAPRPLVVEIHADAGVIRFSVAFAGAQEVVRELGASWKALDRQPEEQELADRDFVKGALSALYAQLIVRDPAVRALAEDGRDWVIPRERVRGIAVREATEAEGQAVAARRPIGFQAPASSNARALPVGIVGVRRKGR